MYCNETDTCNIDCLSQFACNTLNLYCEGNCYVRAFGSSLFTLFELNNGESCDKSFECENNYIMAINNSDINCFGDNSCNNAIFIRTTNVDGGKY